MYIIINKFKFLFIYFIYFIYYFVFRQLQKDILKAQQKAMENLKKNEEKQKAEENERFRLKDQIDEKVIILRSIKNIKYIFNNIYFFIIINVIYLFL